VSPLDCCPELFSTVYVTQHCGGVQNPSMTLHNRNCSWWYRDEAGSNITRLAKLTQ
jgi:hypothetical protein